MSPLKKISFDRHFRSHPSGLVTSGRPGGISLFVIFRFMYLFLNFDRLFPLFIIGAT